MKQLCRVSVSIPSYSITLQTNSCRTHPTQVPSIQNTTITKTKSINATTTDTYLQTMPTTDLRLPFRVDLIDKLHHSDALDPTASRGDHRTPAITSRLHRRGGRTAQQSNAGVFPCASPSATAPVPRKLLAASRTLSCDRRLVHRAQGLPPSPAFIAGAAPPPTLSYPSWPIPAAPPSGVQARRSSAAWMRAHLPHSGGPSAVRWPRRLRHRDRWRRISMP
ncbi:uncharacterized protein M6B38_204570 [Iris pallida]|uniref:Uncharacterized protein n=1 Tax=Iris pallida TaxID=29817 RepID=A0AAX6E770_IRIPA|nr:uncharacterized protein M6B38_204570 [Iris pallida]